MIKRTRITTVGIIVAIIAAACASSADASHEAVNVALSQPVILAGSTQTVYLKIGLQVDGEGDYRAPVNLAVVVDRSGHFANYWGGHLGMARSGQRTSGRGRRRRGGGS